VFMVGSIGCALSTSVTDFVIARILQGMGGAMMTPVGRLVLLRSIDKSALVNAMAWVTVPALIGPVIGPPLGGFITTYFSWHWIFLINIPIGLLGIFIDPERIDPQHFFDGEISRYIAYVKDTKPAAGTPEVLAALTKGGLAAATRSLAVEYASRGIRVNAVSPGIIQTHPADSYDGLGGRLPPLGRVGQVSDVVDGVLFLESSSYVTGEILHIDGGQVAGH